MLRRLQLPRRGYDLPEELLGVRLGQGSQELLGGGGLLPHAGVRLGSLGLGPIVEIVHGDS